MSELTESQKLSAATQYIEQLEAERDELVASFRWLEHEAKKSQTGISFDWIPTCDGERSGYRFMRYHFVSEPFKTLQKAIDAVRRQSEGSNS